MVKPADNIIISFTDPSKLGGDLSSLYLSKNFSDVILHIGAEKLPAHKAILSARSEHFKALFAENSLDATQNVITLDDISHEYFLKVLKYIYTGSVSVSSDTEFLHVMVLANKLKFADLKSGLATQFKPNLTVKSVGSLLNAANLQDVEELRAVCHTFMDSNAPEILLDDCLRNLSEQSVVGLLKRDTFVAPEIEIFRSLVRWCRGNSHDEGVVMKCVRLPLMSIVEILKFVRPTKLVTYENIVDAIAEIVDVKPKTAKHRTILLIDENIASPLHKAEVITGLRTSEMLTGNRNVNKYGEIPIDGESGFVIKLNNVSFMNHINMRLWDDDARHYSYYIEVSLDQEKWRRIIDYSRFACRSVQHLYFDQELVKYIKIVGTRNTAFAVFHLIYVEVYLKSSVPRFLNGVVYPDTNVATAEQHAKVIEGQKPEFLLNGDTKNYDKETGYTCHFIGAGQIIVQLAQPYMISSMRLLLWDKEDISYRYFIETSVDKNEWEMAVDRRNEPCKSWQNIHFKERAIVFVKITGTYNGANDVLFQCVHFECPAQDGK